VFSGVNEAYGVTNAADGALHLFKAEAEITNYVVGNV
jgi:hypothetical protein